NLHRRMFMGIDFLVFTTVATLATIMPVYQIRGFLVKLLKIPVLGWLLIIGYGIAFSMILLKLFSFKSSMAGLANLTSSILFTLWIYWEQKKALLSKQK